MKKYPYNPVDYYDDMQQMLESTAAKFGSRVCVTTYDRQGEKSEYSFARIREDVRAFAKGLMMERLAGEHIALIGENSYEWLLAFLGTAVSGGVAVCIDIEQSLDAIAELVAFSDAVAIVTSQPMAGICKAIQKANKKVRKLIIIDEPGERGFEAFLKRGKNSDPEIAFKLDKNQTASIVFTSGTTGKAKAVMLSHRALLYNAADALALLDYEDPFFFAMLPFYHAYGFTCQPLACLIEGLNCCINGDLKTMIRDMTLFKPEIVMAVPLVVEALYNYIWKAIEQSGQKQKVRSALRMGKTLGISGLLLKKPMQEKFKGTALERLKTIICGGAYLGQTIAEELEAFGILVLQGYGISECGPLVSVNRNKSYNHTSVGYVVPHYHVMIKDEEILVRGESLMNGYYKDEEATRLSFDQGWFKTGDIGFIDKNGRLHIQGRTKNLIVMKNGKKISPEEIEAMVAIDPLVKDVLAYGLNSGESADDVKLAIMIYPDPDATRGMESYEILEHLHRFVETLNANLPAYKQIQMINIREQDFPRTATKKIRRGASATEVSNA